MIALVDPGDPVDLDPIFRALQTLLRQRQITYRGLAEALKMSESGVKKMFSARDCTLSRLSQIAKFLNISLGDLWSLSEQPPIPEVRLTQAQQVFLLNHPACFAFYWLLTIDRLSVRVIQSRYKLTATRCRQFIHQLDDLNLISLQQPGDRVRLPATPLLRWTDQGPLMSHLNHLWAHTVCDDAAPHQQQQQQAGEGPGLFRLHGLLLSASLAQSLVETLESACDTFIRRAHLSPPSTQDGQTVRLLVALAPGPFIREIPEGP